MYHNYKTSLTKLVLFSLVVFLAASTLTAAQKVPYTKSQVDNLINGMESDNTGLKQSAVILAGKYRIVEVTELLRKMLQEEENSSTIILIAYSLYQIENNAAMVDVLQKGQFSQDYTVRNLLTSMALEYFQKDLDYSVQVSK